ncbi:hypothetical protein B0A49_01391 [Cryomyces minteri]|uniref:Uncharacterized protein n=1 Tax=Cryomyces minteri TaxID=331657 RepID=A0A4U0XQV5_9PEZI|nr:hypothetical protein B0A49_01391 [Cryomyces minteri]
MELGLLILNAIVGVFFCIACEERKTPGGALLANIVFGVTFFIWYVDFRIFLLSDAYLNLLDLLTLARSVPHRVANSAAVSALQTLRNLVDSYVGFLLGLAFFAALLSWVVSTDKTNYRGRFEAPWFREDGSLPGVISRYPASEVDDSEDEAEEEDVDRDRELGSSAGRATSSDTSRPAAVTSGGSIGDLGHPRMSGRTCDQLDADRKGERSNEATALRKESHRESSSADDAAFEEMNYHFIERLCAIRDSEAALVASRERESKRTWALYRERLRQRRGASSSVASAQQAHTASREPQGVKTSGAVASTTLGREDKTVQQVQETVTSPAPLAACPVGDPVTVNSVDTEGGRSSTNDAVSAAAVPVSAPSQSMSSTGPPRINFQLLQQRRDAEMVRLGLDPTQPLSQISTSAALPAPQLVVEQPAVVFPSASYEETYGSWQAQPATQVVEQPAVVVPSTSYEETHGSWQAQPAMQMEDASMELDGGSDRDGGVDVGWRGEEYMGQASTINSMQNQGHESSGPVLQFPTTSWEEMRVASLEEVSPVFTEVAPIQPPKFPQPSQGWANWDSNDDDMIIITEFWAPFMPPYWFKNGTALPTVTTTDLGDPQQSDPDPAPLGEGSAGGPSVEPAPLVPSSAVMPSVGINPGLGVPPPSGTYSARLSQTSAGPSIDPAPLVPSSSAVMLPALSPHAAAQMRRRMTRDLFSGRVSQQRRRLPPPAVAAAIAAAAAPPAAAAPATTTATAAAAAPAPPAPNAPVMRVAPARKFAADLSFADWLPDDGPEPPIDGSGPTKISKHPTHVFGLPDDMAQSLNEAVPDPPDYSAPKGTGYVVTQVTTPYTPTALAVPVVPVVPVVQTPDIPRLYKRRPPPSPLFPPRRGK